MSCSSELPPSSVFQIIFESLPDLYLVLTPEFKMVAASNKYLEATKVTSKQLVNRNLFELFPDNPNDPTATGTKNLKASLDRVLKNKVPDKMAIQKYDIRRPDSEGGGFEERYWSPVNSPILNDKQEVIYIIHRVEDVTQSVVTTKTHEQRLHIAQERYHAIFDAIDEAFCVIEVIFDQQNKANDYRYIEVNPSFAKHSGLANAVGKRMRELVPDFDEQWFESFGHVAVTGDPISFQSYSNPLKRWLDVSAFRFGDPTERQVAVLFRDISADKQSEKDLLEMKELAEQANAAKSDFLAKMSHDIRTPLNGIIGMCDLLLGTEQTQQQTRYNQILKSSANSLSILINDILDFSKIEAGKLELSNVEFNLYKAVEDIASTLSYQASKKGLELICYIEPNVPPLVHGDPDRLWQILVNLINNAVKFTDSGHVIVWVRLKELGDAGLSTIYFEVLDSGIGLSEEQVGKLFKAFSQADVTTTRKFGGTGLGLAIAKQLVEMMDGKIGVISEPNRGSTFWFTVKLRASLMDSSAVSFNTILQEQEILIVDDNSTNLEILARQISDLGLKSQSASSGVEALEKLDRAYTQGSPFALVISDFDMPGMNGLELGTTIRLDQRFNALPMILLSSVQNEFSPSQLMRAGYSEVKIKPIRQSKLLDSILTNVGSLKSGKLFSPQSSRKGSIVCLGKILVADDNDVNQIVISEILSNAGYTFDVVADGESAFKAAKQGKYDLIIMDCSMPVMDGLEATRKIRQWERINDLGFTPIIALTANAQVSFRDECLQSGMSNFCTKPVDANKLLRIIEPYFTHPTSKIVSGQSEEIEERKRETKFDVDELVNRCGGKKDTAILILDKLKEQIVNEVILLRVALERKETQKIAAVAHSLRGAANMAGAADLGQIAESIEESGRGGDLAAVSTSILLLQKEAESCLSRIPHIRRSLES